MDILLYPAIGLRSLHPECGMLKMLCWALNASTILTVESASVRPSSRLSLI
jgi:hypothetical protein